MSDPPSTFRSASGVGLSVLVSLVPSFSRWRRRHFELYFIWEDYIWSCTFRLRGERVADLMASAVFEGTSLVNMFVKDCWVNGIRKLIIKPRGEEEEFFDIRTEWSDRNVVYIHRSYADLGRLFKRLLECFPEDRRDLSKSPLLEGRYKLYVHWLSNNQASQKKKNNVAHK